MFIQLSTSVWKYVTVIKRWVGRRGRTSKYAYSSGQLNETLQLLKADER
jgi:hypothetical protein